MAHNVYKKDFVIYPIFFLSGFSALIYQVVWQRSLFTIYGVNIESITIVVAAFMLGLGLGSIFGGWISRNPRVPVLAVFCCTELTIGMFGFFSLGLFDRVGFHTLHLSLLQTGLTTFVLLLVPTAMMGATLPLLVAYLVRKSSNVGRSTGSLYFVNTLGASAACFCTAFFMMETLGKHGCIVVAALLNLFVASWAFIFYIARRRLPEAGAFLRPVQPNRADKTGVPFPAALAIVFLSGFIALSYEMVWIRVFTLGFASTAASFPLVLGMYLAGLAWGSLEAKRFCPDGPLEKTKLNLQVLAAFILLANIFGFLLTPLIAQFFRFDGFRLALLAILPAAACLGVILPLVSHLAIRPDDNAGSRLSYLYLSNIVGSTIGTYATGFILMDLLNLKNMTIMLLCLGSVMTIILLSAGRVHKRGLAVTVVSSIVLLASSGFLYDQVYEHLLFKNEFAARTRFSHVVENRSGVIMVSDDGTVYGEGVYDGKFNTDLVHDTNGIFRAFSLSLFHPSPREVLMVGLSSGSWAQVIANNPAIEKLTIVEINPGYLKLIPRYPMVASLLENPKVNIIIDDGRRWLNRNSGTQFDAIVMNTTFYWRAFASNLLSVEFLRLARQHLRRGGVLLYNTTGSPEAQRTGATVFPYGYRLWNILVVSDSPILLDKGRWEAMLRHYRIDGLPVLDLKKKADGETLKALLSLPEALGEKETRELGMESREGILVRTRGIRIITDDNMITEWANNRN